MMKFDMLPRLNSEISEDLYQSDLVLLKEAFRRNNIKLDEEMSTEKTQYLLKRGSIVIAALVLILGIFLAI